MRGVKAKRDLSSLLTYDDKVHGWRSECASLTVLMRNWGEYLAHATTRALDTTSHGTGTVRQELSHVWEAWEAIGEKQAEEDCLLLRQAHGCEQFKGSCHFNQLDNAQSVNKKASIINEIISNIRKGE